MMAWILWHHIFATMNAQHLDQSNAQAMDIKHAENMILIHAWNGVLLQAALQDKHAAMEYAAHLIIIATMNAQHLDQSNAQAMDIKHAENMILIHAWNGALLQAALQDKHAAMEYAAHLIIIAVAMALIKMDCVILIVMLMNYAMENYLCQH